MRQYEKMNADQLLNRWVMLDFLCPEVRRRRPAWTAVDLMDTVENRGWNDLAEPNWTTLVLLQHGDSGVSAELNLRLFKARNRSLETIVE